MALLTFLGAIQQVTGSCYLVESRDDAKVLLECGMHQGRRQEEDQNRSAFPFDPRELDAVVISHAHLDHSGLLPRLVAEGYRGPIHATEASSELLELMLLDSAFLQEKDASGRTAGVHARASRRSRRSTPSPMPSRRSASAARMPTAQR